MDVSWDDDEEVGWEPTQPKSWYKGKAKTSNSNNMSQTTIREGYDITIIDCSFLVDELIQYTKVTKVYDVIKTASTQSNRLKSLRIPKSKEWLSVTTCPRLRHSNIPSKFHEAAASAIWSLALGRIREHGKIKTEQRDETPMPAPAEAERKRSSSVVSNMSTASMTEQMGLTALDTAVVLNEANVSIIDIVSRKVARSFPLCRLMSTARQTQLEDGDFEIKPHHLKFDMLVKYLSQQKFSEWYIHGKSEIFDALACQPITDDDDLLTTVNLHLKVKKLAGIAIECRGSVSTKRKTTVRFEASSFSPPPTPKQRDSRKKKRRTFMESSDSDSDSPANQRRKKKPRVPVNTSDEDSDLPAIQRRRRRERDAAAKAASRAKEEEAASRAKEEKAAAERRKAAMRMEKTLEGAASPKTTQEQHEERRREKDERSTKTSKGRRKDEQSEDSPSDSDKITEPDDDDNDEDNSKSAKELAKEDLERLQALLNARAQDALKERAGLEMEHCTLGEWQDTADFFGIRIEDLQEGEPIRLPASWGLAVEFTPYQLSEAYLLYKKERSSDNGGIFANMMGMGKTRAMLLKLLIGHIHWRNWLEVNRARAELDITRHRAKGDEREQCPTANERTFRCACEAHPSMPETPRECPTLTSGWGRAADAWKKEVGEMGFMRSRWCKWGDPLSLRFCFMDNNPPLGMGPPIEDEEVEMRVAPDFDKYLAQYNKTVQPREFIKDGAKVFETVPWTIKDGDMPRCHKDATEHRPAPTAGRIMIICGFSTLQSRVLKKYNTMRVPIYRTVTKKGVPTVERGWLTIPGHMVVWGRVIFDEFHNCKSEDTIIGKLYKDLREHNHGYQWKAWALSGTPMEKGLHEILIFVTLALVGLVDSDGVSNWDQPFGEVDKDGFIKYKMVDEVYKSVATTLPAQGRRKQMPAGMVMAKSWANTISKAKDGVDQVTKSEEYEELMKVGVKISARFMLRRTLLTQDPWGKKISGIKGDFLTFFRPCVYSDFLASVHRAAQRCRTVLINEGLDKDTADGTVIFNRAEMQAIASYPGLAELKALEYESKGSKKTRRLVSQHLKQYFATPDEGLIANNIEGLMHSSAKYSQIEHECKKISGSMVPSRNWSQAAEDKAMETGQPVPAKEVPAKILIGSYKPSVQLITWLALRKKYGPDRVLLLRGGMKRPELEETLLKWRDPDGPIILVASMAFAEAITLTEASEVIIIEPQDRQNTQDQFMFRVYRLGQLAKLCKGIILYNPDSELELSVLRKQFVKTASRDVLQGEALKGGEDIDWNTTLDIAMRLEGM